MSGAWCRTLKLSGCSHERQSDYQLWRISEHAIQIYRHPIPSDNNRWVNPVLLFSFNDTILFDQDIDVFLDILHISIYIYNEAILLLLFSIIFVLMLFYYDRGVIYYCWLWNWWQMNAKGAIRYIKHIQMEWIAEFMHISHIV